MSARTEADRIGGAEGHVNVLPNGINVCLAAVMLAEKVVEFQFICLSGSLATCPSPSSVISHSPVFDSQLCNAAVINWASQVG